MLFVNGVRVRWSSEAQDPYQCINPTVREHCRDAVQHRWTLNEMRAIFNAFAIFANAHKNIGIPTFRWPLQIPIYIRKDYDVLGCQFGFTDHNTRTIQLSANAWGERRENETKPACNPALRIESWEPYRAWIVLHEFNHLFVLERAESIVATLKEAGKRKETVISYLDGTLQNEIDVAGFSRYPPTGYGGKWKDEFEVRPGFWTQQK